MNPQKEILKDVIRQLPEKPGVYRYYDLDGTLLYVGKAKNLKKRVGSYFTNKDLDRKTRSLVSQINEIKFTVVNSEFEAYLLENNFIKENQPKYNILLKDDKTYPFIVVLNERFPQIFSTRKPESYNAKRFGPFTSIKAMNSVLELVHKIMTIRTCTLNLSEKNISEKKFKVCLEFHLGNCKGPCENLQTEEEYNQDVKQALNILNGDLAIVKRHFKEQMESYASKMEFEKAAVLKDKIDLLDRYQSKSPIVTDNEADLDIITIHAGENEYFVNIIQVKKGRIINSKNELIKKTLDETEEDVIIHTLLDYRTEYSSTANQVISNKTIEIENSTFKIFTPERGDKKQLLDLSLQNLDEFIQQLTFEKKSNERANRILEKLQKDLSLKELPFVIECFDNSNFQGKAAVSSMVTFRNGKPDKKNYRIFNVKTVEGPDDFSTMKEVIYRRYKRVIEENKPKPNLIIVDGGKGQLSSAVESLKKLGIYGLIPIISIAKRLEEIYMPGDEFPLYIDKKSESLKLIQQLRDEAHRFGIKNHRQRLEKTVQATTLDEIKELVKRQKSYC